MESFEEDDALFDLAQAMRSHAGHREQRKRLDYPAAQRARAYLDSATRRRVSLTDLEKISGQTRWRLSRDFRGLFGTSPYRYLTMRRLDDAKYQLRAGMSIADAAVTAGFADQSHLTRQFADAFGITPGRWAALAKTRDRNQPFFDRAV